MKPRLSLRELFETALKLSGEARTQLLDERCVDPVRRAEVEQLLAADAIADDLPASGDAALAARAIGDPDLATMLAPASEVGPFELIEVLGQGGASTVFRAFREDQGVRQEVALKLLAKGLYSSEAKRQFRREREALARLRHPGIARLIEGGITNGGLAYIALELVDGVTITTYVNQHRLDLRATLELFISVCRAVDSAHRALIVHRDLKPSNVLVTADGDVKLLDFGIAQLLDEDTDICAHSPMRALTPAYAAPEQFSHQPVTTAADVYALGILLEELLCGERTPQDNGLGSAPTPVLKGKLKSRSRGELGHIVGMATAFAAGDRYRSAGALADDIKRFLSRKPVLACPTSRRYRLEKYAQRYRAGVATMAAFLLAIFLALGVVVWQAEVAREQAARADAVRDFLVSVFQSSGAGLPMDERPTPQDLVAQASTRLMFHEGLHDAQRVDLLLTVAKVALSVGSDEQALALLDRGAPIIGRLYGPEDVLWWDARVLRAAVQEDEGRHVDVINLLYPLRIPLAMRHDRIGVDGMRALGKALLHDGRAEQGLALLEGARAIASQAGLHDVQLSVSIDEAIALLETTHFAAGLARADKTLDLWQASDRRTDQRIVDLYEAIALGAQGAGDMVRAENAYRQAIVTGRRFFDKPNRQQARNVGMYGAFLIAQQRFDEAEPYAARGLQLRRRAFGMDDPRTLRGVADMGQLRYGQGRFKQAVDWYSQGIESCRRTLLKQPVCPRLLGLRALAWTATGHFDKAATDIDAALNAQQAFEGNSNSNYAYLLEQLASLQLARRQYLQAVATTDRVLAIYRCVEGAMAQRTIATRLARAQALFALGRTQEALQQVLNIESRYEAMFPAGEARFGLLSLKARALSRAHRAEEAAVAARDALHAQPLRPGVDSMLVAQLARIAAPEKGTLPR